MLAHLGYKAYRTTSEEIIADMFAGWPQADGIWGQIVAMHHSVPNLVLQ